MMAIVDGLQVQSKLNFLLIIIKNFTNVKQYFTNARNKKDNKKQKNSIHQKLS